MFNIECLLDHSRDYLGKLHS